MRTAVLIACVAATLSAALPARGHDLELTRALLILRTDGTWQVDMICDLDALALGASPTTDSAELAAILRRLDETEMAREINDLRRTFERRVRIRFDGQPVAPTVSFPEHGTPLADDATVATVLGLTARLEGRVPEGAAEVTFGASRAFPPVHLTILDERRLTGHRQLLDQGISSQPYRLNGKVGEEDGVRSEPLETAGRYLVLGFWHIVPEGLDHMLFVLGLFLLAARWRPLMWQVSAFTLAHTLTLALSSYGLVRLPPSLVEPLIALSIAYVAIENLFTSELKPWRPLVVFAFGLLHGLGFAGVLGQLGLPAGEHLTALLAFNGGVELGQLAVLLAAFCALGWWRNRPWYRFRVAMPLSLGIAVTGLYWAVTRVLCS